MVRIDIRCNLEDETSELLLFRRYHALLCLGGLRTRCDLHEAVQQFLYTEVVQGRAEEYRCHLSGTIGLHVKGRIHTIHQFQVLAQLLSILLSNHIINIRVRTPLARWRGVGGEAYLHLLCHPLLVGCEQVELLLIDVIHSFELRSLVDRPRQRSYLDLQFLFQLIEQVERITSFAVHLVDEDNHRGVPHSAYVHQLTSLCLHTLGAVNHDDGGIHGGQRAVGVFGKVLVTRGVEDVHLIFNARLLWRIVKLHHRG